MNNKPVADATPQDFIQHSANLDYYERSLSGLIRLGKNISEPELYRSTDSLVKKYRAEREAYFKWHGIVSDIAKALGQ